MSFLMGLVPAPYRWLLFAVAGAILVGFGFVRGVLYEESKFDAYKEEQSKATLKAALVASQKTANLLSDAQVLEGIKDAEVKAIDARLRAALGELQKRPDRPAANLSRDTPVGNGGCAPVQLYREDAAVALQLAADADKLRVAFEACQTQYNQVREQINGKR